MADEATTPVEEAISTTTEGSISTLENATPDEVQPKLIPESDLMAVKDKAQRKEAQLKARIAELEAEHTPKKSSSPDLETLKAKYQGVDADFLEDMVALAEKKAEEKLAPVRTQQSKEKFEKDWNALYTDQLAKAEGVDKNRVNSEYIKTLALAPQNRGRPVKDIIEELYKVEPTGRATTENDMRPAMDLVTDVADIDNLSNEQKKRIFADPKARKKYMDAKYQ